VQRDRSSTLNADKILRFTHAITHMQHLTFSAKPYHEQPAQVYFITPATNILPLHCYTVYLAYPINATELERLQSQFAPNGLLVDYTHAHNLTAAGFQSKTKLEASVTLKWAEVAAFFDKFSIDISSLSHQTQQSNDRMDDALDTLLGIGHEFLHLARDFQHTFELAQPLDMHMQTKQQYMTLSILAHRVQSLMPGPEYYRFNTAGADDHTFFLHDRAPEALSKLELIQEVAQQLQAGRFRLANALQAYLLHSQASSSVTFNNFLPLIS
jgi:hypothetical protein